VTPAVAGGRAVRARDVVFLVSAVVMAAVFVRLGFWQLSRLAERRARNALVIARLGGGEPAVPFAKLPRDSAEARYRRVRISGTYDFAHEVVFVNRVRDGAPGVQLVTPLIPDSGVLGDTVVLVDRGWVYAPDGTTVETAAWREPAHLDGSGYVQEYLVLGQFAAVLPGHPAWYRWLDPAVIAKAVGRPVAGYYVVLDSGGGGGPRLPQRVPTPPLDEGPHLSYAIQWFSFAAIALAGSFMGVFVLPKYRADSRAGSGTVE
jgi:surfeit locus 1 family protein